MFKATYSTPASALRNIKSLKTGTARVKTITSVLFCVALCGVAALTSPVQAAPKGKSISATASADGALSVNASWEAGKSATWYIELQRGGSDIVQNGMDQENDAMIRQGLKMLDWGFAHQAADGSFAANGVLTAGGQTGSAFHSTGIFVESAARTTLALQRYKPLTYKPDAAFYTGVLARYTAGLHAAGLWMTRPDVAPIGAAIDTPFTHRRYLNAAALAEIGALCSDPSLTATAANFAAAGVALQLPSGINPELGGYDVSYQCAGLFFAQQYLKYCSDPTLQAQMTQMVEDGLTWEAGRVDLHGNVDATGSTRVGIELNRDGTVKQPNLTEICQAFGLGYKLTGDRNFRIIVNRMTADPTISSNVVASDGSVDYNTGWEKGTSPIWSISLQKVGADYVTAGISQENDALIRQGLKMLDWGFAHQTDTGSFSGTESSFFGAAQFLEAATRAAQALNSYHPVTYSGSRTYYNSVVTRYRAAIYAGATYLLQPKIATKGQANIGMSTSRWYAVGAALAEAGNFVHEPLFLTASLPYAAHALALQWADGANPENGAGDVNYQAIGLQYALRLYQAYPAGLQQTVLGASCLAGLHWQSGKIDLNGHVLGTPAPATRTIDQALTAGKNLFPDRVIEVSDNRLDANLSQN